jgi:hypothetical protein
MTINEARLIAAIKSPGRCTMRALAEIYYPPEHELHGIQWAGQDLCRQATAILGKQSNVHEEDFLNSWTRKNNSQEQVDFTNYMDYINE